MRYGFVFFLVFSTAVQAQVLTNARQKFIPAGVDSFLIDTLSLIPSSVFILDNGNAVDTSAYHIDYASARLIWKDNTVISADSLLIVYRVFPINFSRRYAFRSQEDKKIGSGEEKNVYIYSPEERSQELFRIEGLNKSGSISRGITVGNNQDAVVNSSLNLQLSGRLSNNIDVAAAITDDNIPVQPEGNTQQLQEFDKVYIQLSNERNKLIAGDFELTKPQGYFMNFYKKGQGALYSNKSRLGRNTNSPELHSTVSGAVSKGKFARNTFNGIESNQGPYRLTGAENEMFIIILSGSEKIYIDGQLLKRGQAHDYVIDYNTAEITFTPRRLITKDTRIVAEFQYSDKNYARTLLFGSVQMNYRNSKTWVNVYSEQDSKNQPLQQDLDDEQKRLLAAAGDDIFTAVSPNVDSVPFNANEILYSKRDTLVNGLVYTIYVWSVNPDSAFYRLGFSMVGSNNGNYILTTGAANGRVYQWVAPVNGVPQGNYEPVFLLTAPKKRQMISAGYGFSNPDVNDFSVEISGSNDDVNTFARHDKSNDKGWAAVTSYRHSIPVFRNAKMPWQLVAGARYEFTYRHFKPVENYRPVEFTRDWNTAALTDTSDEHNTSAGLTLQQGPLQSMSYTLRTYNRTGIYNGLMHVWNSGNTYKRFALKADASYLNTDGTSVNSEFLRHKEDLSYNWNKVITGITMEEERNEFYSSTEDSISPASFAFRSGGLYIKTADTVKIAASVSYTKRLDELPLNGKLVEATEADNITGSIALNINKSNRITAGATYRKLEVKDTLATAQDPDESVLSRIEHQLTVAKGFITATTFYEVGSGQEQKKEFSYIEVAAGTGNYSWNDYNDDGIPQLNEFETPQFQDQANYIRIFTPTADYVKVYTNQLNLVMNIQPGALNRDNLWSKLSFLSAWRFDNKITGTDPEEALNPFITSIEEQSLIATNASSRNTLFINKTGRVFGTDITYNEQLNKQLLSNGIEARSSRSFQSNTRINFSTSFSGQTDLEYEIRKNTSEAFSMRNYLLDIYKAGEKISFQPGTVYRISLLYNVTQKENTIGDVGEKSLTQNGGLEFRYSSVKRGLLTAAFNLVHINFNQPENTPLAYEMLEGLKAGINYTWSLSVQRNISSALQISLNYEGRKSEGVRTIHTGGVQARAFF